MVCGHRACGKQVSVFVVGKRFCEGKLTNTNGQCLPDVYQLILDAYGVCDSHLHNKIGVMNSIRALP